MFKKTIFVTAIILGILSSMHQNCFAQEKTEDELKNIKQKRLETWYNKSEIERNKTLEKRKKTLMERYGVEHTFDSPIIKEKIKTSFTGII